MKNHFLKLFHYDKHANLQILEAIFEANQPQDAVKLMTHLLAAQQIWLLRCKATPAQGAQLWPDGQAVQFKYIIEENHSAWTGFINSLTDDDINRTSTYSNSKGEQFENNLVDIFTHLINHGTHHRAQIGQQLKLAGLEKLPATDFIFFVRGQNQ